MKLQRRLKGLADVTHRDHPPRPQQPIEKMTHRQQREFLADTQRWLAAQEERHRQQDVAARTSPLTAHAAGVGYRGPNMPDKGKKDGSCNVTACQMPLAGLPQFYMRDHMVHNGRLYYCASCERKFTEWDLQSGDPLRCTADEDN